MQKGSVTRAFLGVGIHVGARAHRWGAALSIGHRYLITSHGHGAIWKNAPQTSAGFQ